MKNIIKPCQKGMNGFENEQIKHLLKVKQTVLPKLVPGVSFIGITGSRIVARIKQNEILKNAVLNTYAISDMQILTSKAILLGTLCKQSKKVLFTS